MTTLLRCPKCGGSQRLDRDIDGWSLHCRDCGHDTPLKPVALRLARVKGSTASKLEYNGNDNRVAGQQQATKMLTTLGRAVKRKE
jgi:hypothetical protein